MFNQTLLLASLEPCWLWWLILSALAFILGALLACLLCSNRKRLRELEEENEGLKARVTNWEKDYNGLKYQHEEIQKELKTVRQKLNSCEADKAVLNTKLQKLQSEAEGDDAAKATLASGTVVDTAGSEGQGGQLAFANIFPSDNLQIIEGIGPKIEAVLKDGGIVNWELLAAANEEQLRSILTAANPSYRIHDTKSWPEQAELAQEGKWEELIALQKQLGGDASEETAATDSKVEKMAVKVLGFSSNPEDLTIIEGIGPKIQQLLKDGGINTWQDLANAEVEKIQEILSEAGSNFRLAKPATWPQQAALAAKGLWAELQQLQERLQGGIDR